MAYFAASSLFKRQVPLYARPPLFHLDTVNLIFKAPRPFYGRYAFSRAIQPIVNFSRATQEFYEGFVASWFPCYELRFLMTRLVT